ncbi:hypothetical protein CYMTET_19200 [Cymbomonas tetramitiformis]|uniref:Uncharacterized protein n=1 Tax=Cymbomonas tetramitiformis TaxID=36881 RepID=A0AAE0L576_9CHLO|nr:hypothetical protein CYMTET_19200 [Cymbomonas tetramitiformis]
MSCKAETLVNTECTDNGSKLPRLRLRGFMEVSRAVQKHVFEPPGPAEPGATTRLDKGLQLAAPHHFRGRMHLQLAQEYREAVWDKMKHPRKFYIKWRGFGPSDNRHSLPSFREIFLRLALASASRAVDLAPESVECGFLKACVLWALALNHSTTVNGERKYVKVIALPSLQSVELAILNIAS